MMIKPKWIEPIIKWSPFVFFTILFWIFIALHCNHVWMNDEEKTRADNNERNNKSRWFFRQILTTTTTKNRETNVTITIGLGTGTWIRGTILLENYFNVYSAFKYVISSVFNSFWLRLGFPFSSVIAFFFCLKWPLVPLV